MRVYPRDEIKWDLDTLRALAELDPPQATYFEKADRWVVKQDGQSFGIKPEQIIDAKLETYQARPKLTDWLVDNDAEAALADEAQRLQAEADRKAEEAYLRGRTPAQVENAVYERAVAPAGSSLDAQIDDLLDYFTK